MGFPLLAADNLLNVLQYPQHVLLDQSGTIGPTGYEAWHIADGRRSQFDFWHPGTTNVDSFVRLTANVPRPANYLSLDRGHNLAGKVVQLIGSPNNFVT